MRSRGGCAGLGRWPVTWAYSRFLALLLLAVPGVSRSQSSDAAFWSSDEHGIRLRLPSDGAWVYGPVTERAPLQLIDPTTRRVFKLGVGPAPGRSALLDITRALEQGFLDQGGGRVVSRRETSLGGLRARQVVLQRTTRHGDFTFIAVTSESADGTYILSMTVGGLVESDPDFSAIVRSLAFVRPPARLPAAPDDPAMEFAYQVGRLEGLIALVVIAVIAVFALARRQRVS